MLEEEGLKKGKGIGIDSNRFIGFFVRSSTYDNEVHSCSSGLGGLWRAGLD
jgi:hypothetical protein